MTARNPNDILTIKFTRAEWENIAVALQFSRMSLDRLPRGNLSVESSLDLEITERAIERVIDFAGRLTGPKGKTEVTSEAFANLRIDLND